MATTAEIVRFRRAFVETKRRPKKIPKQRRPKAGELRYHKLLVDVRKTHRRLLNEMVIAELSQFLEKSSQELGGLRADALADDIIRVFSNLALQFATIHPPGEIDSELTSIATDIDAHQSREHQRQMKAALGLELIVPEPFRQSAIRGFVATNQALVESLTGDAFAAFQSITNRGIQSGLRVEDIAKELLARLKITQNKARFLAVDQTNKLFGQLTELRQTNVGIEEYVWDDSDDERVRPRHRALDQTPQKWSKPPIVDLKTGRRAHPGGDYRCRCQALPVFPAELLVPVRGQ
jgi:SPP1 gp7 family putative phage head morphogenesis protein